MREQLKNEDFLIESLNNESDLIQELMEINPRLINKAGNELLSLIDTIHECGYKWDKKKLCFVNDEIHSAIRTQGLDLFTAEKFKEKYEFWKQRNTTPEYIKFAMLAEKFKKVLYLIIAYTLLGWIVIPFKIWIISLVSVVIIFIAAKVLILEKRMKKSDEALNLKK